MVPVHVPDKATDAKTEKRNSGVGVEKTFFFWSSTSPVCLQQETVLWWLLKLTWNSIEGFVLFSTGSGALYLDRAEENPAGTVTGQVQHQQLPLLKVFSGCDTVWLWWHLLPTLQGSHTSPEGLQVPALPWGEFSLVLVEGRDGEKQVMEGNHLSSFPYFLSLHLHFKKKES